MTAVRPATKELDSNSLLQLTAYGLVRYTHSLTTITVTLKYNKTTESRTVSRLGNDQSYGYGHRSYAVVCLSPVSDACNSDRLDHRA